MLIKFIPPDPRAGMTARMDSSRGAYFVERGNAVRVTEQGDAVVEATPTPADPPGETDRHEEEQEQEEQEQDTKPVRDLPALAAAFVDGTVTDVTARIEGADEELLKAALATETAGEKPRKGVVDALTSALTPQA